MNTGLYVLRCARLGISISDLELLSMGIVFDVFTELENDDYDYPYRATQEDIDRL